MIFPWGTRHPHSSWGLGCSVLGGKGLEGPPWARWGRLNRYGAERATITLCDGQAPRCDPTFLSLSQLAEPNPHLWHGTMLIENGRIELKG